MILLPPFACDTTSATGTDTIGPLSIELTSLLPIDPWDADTGFTLIAPFAQKNVYLVNQNQSVVHTWQTNRKTMGTTILLENGTLLRGGTGAPGQPDGIHLLDWNGSILWEYRPPSEFSWHHDFELMPNGNILLNTGAPMTFERAVLMGRDPEITPMHFQVESIVEIKPNGPNGGDVVWRWDPLDHIIQGYDPGMPNYGVVRDHPELIDFNYPLQDLSEWQHSNAVSYNAELDQVMITDRAFDEFWIIDHNTTMAEAAGHSGGAHGRGGDILYRWGNPQAYGAGSDSDRILYGPHDAHWIGPGLPGEGNIIVYNNGLNMYLRRPEGNYSTIEELVPPLNATGGYDLVPGSAYGPPDTVWSYNASPPESFYGWSMGGVERLPNNHTLICAGSSGRIFEVDDKNRVVWDYKTGGTFQASRYYSPGLKKVPALEAFEDVTLRVNISSFISDIDTELEDLVLSEDSPLVNLSGHELIMQYPEGIRTDFFRLTVSDGIFKVRREVRVTIIPVNDPPVVSQIPDITAVEGVPYTLDLKPFVIDVDTDIDHMSFKVDSSFVTVAGSELRFLYPNGVLSDRVNLSVNDGELEDRAEILVNVTPVNDPPIVDRIPDQEGLEDVPWTLDIGMYIRDVDDPIEDIWMVSESRYTSVSGLNLSLLYPEGNTRDVVSLTVSDGESETVVEFNVIIEPVNDPPVIWDIQPLTVTEDEPFSLDVGPSIIDMDTPREELILTVDSPFINVENLTLILLYPDGVNEDEVVVVLSDGDLHASTTLVVSIEPVNDPPMITDIGPLAVTEDERFTFDVGPSLFDIDTPEEELTLRVDSPFIEVQDHTLVLHYPDGITRDEVVVEIWDGDLHGNTTLVVNIEPVNDPPWWAGLPVIYAVEDVEGMFDLVPYMMDIDTPLSGLVVEVASSYGRVEDHVFIFNYPNGMLSERIAFTLSDSEFHVVIRMNVTISPVNDAPELYGADVDPPEGKAGKSLKFTVVFKDIDMGSDDPVVEVVIDGVAYRCTREDRDAGHFGEGVVFIVEMDLGSGDHSFHFIANDGDGGLATTETLTAAVTDNTETRDRTDLMIIMISLLITGAVVLVAILLIGRKRLSASPCLRRHGSD